MTWTAFTRSCSAGRPLEGIFSAALAVAVLALAGCASSDAPDDSEPTGSDAQDRPAAISQPPGSPSRSRAALPSIDAPGSSARPPSEMSDDSAEDEDDPDAAAGTAGGKVGTAPALFIPAWNPEGETFPAYSVFKDELFAVMRKARKRVVIVTQLFTDGDLATGLFSARIRGLSSGAIVDKGAVRNPFSRHNYLARAQVPVYVVNLSGIEMRGRTTLVIDDTAWRIDVNLDDKTRTPVLLQRSPFTADEVTAWATLKDARPAIAAPVPDVGRGRPAPSAKSPTLLRRRARTASDTIGEDRHQTSGAPIPRRLPRVTRSQRLKNGGFDDDAFPPSGGGAVPSRLPPAPSKESELTE